MSKRGAWDWYDMPYTRKTDTEVVFEIPNFPVGDDVSLNSATFILKSDGSGSFKGTLHSSDSGDTWTFGIIAFSTVLRDKLIEWNGIVSDEIPEEGWPEWSFPLPNFDPALFTHIHYLSLYCCALAITRADPASFKKMERLHNDFISIKQQFIELISRPD